jgi:hypothetical protein
MSPPMSSEWYTVPNFRVRSRSTPSIYPATPLRSEFRVQLIWAKFQFSDKIMLWRPPRYHVEVTP